MEGNARHSESICNSLSEVPTAMPLSAIRDALIRQEETIIFALIERAQFARNDSIYQANGTVGCGQGSFLDFFLGKTEEVHGMARRYNCPDEHPFTEINCEAVLPILEFPLRTRPNVININAKIKSVYLANLLPIIANAGDDEQHGSSATCDIAVLQALSKRIHYGKHVAESKFQKLPEQYSAFIAAGDTDAIMQTLTDSVVEEKLLDRVRKKASTYGQDIGVTQAEMRYKVDPDVIVSMYRDFVIPMTKEVQVMYLLQRLQGTTVTYLGPPGTFSHQASMDYFRNETSKVTYTPVSSFKDVVTAVLSNTSIYGVLPIENSTTGIVKESRDNLIDTTVRVVGEYYLPVTHNLLSQCTSLADVKVVYSHPQAIMQCSQWLTAHLPNAKTVEVSSTARGVEKSLASPDSAAIASVAASEHYQIPMMQADIANTKNNATRFLVVGRHPVSSSGRDRTILIIGVHDQPGALSSVLLSFTKNSVNLAAIESYPHRSESFAYCFWVELVGHETDANVKQAVEEVVGNNTVCSFLRVVGSFMDKKQ